MGLLDSLPPGLLELLQNSARGQNFNAGIGADDASYARAPGPMPPGLVPQQPPPIVPALPQPPEPMARNNQASPLDAAQWPYGPNGAPGDGGPAATDLSSAGRSAPLSLGPAQAAAPAPASPGFGDRLANGFKGMAANMAGGPIGALMGGIAGVAGLNEGGNATEQALLAKGVDPVAARAARNNPELMRQLVTQAFGPNTKTSIGEGYVTDKNGNVSRAYTPEKSPLSLGEGHIYNPKTGKVEVAYEPADKIPAGFVKADDGSMKFIPGGPADPAYIQLAEAKKKDPTGNYVLGRGGEIVKNNPDGTVTVVHKNEAAQPEATLDEPTTKSMASQYLAGDKSVMQNLGRGAQGAANIVKLRTEIYAQANAQGLDGKAIVNNFNEQAGNLAGQRSIGTRSANISLAANEANNMIPIALEASAKVPRGEWMPWNKMVQAYQTNTSSPELARFVAATNSLVNSYVRAVSPSGVPTDSMREHAYSMLNSAQSPQAYEAVTKIMQDEMKAAMAAPAQVRKELRNEAPEAAAAPKPGTYVWTPGSGLVGGK